MRRRLSVLVVLVLLVVAGLAVPASAAAGCRGFGQDLVAATAQQGPNAISDVATASRGDLGHSDVDILKFFNCP